MSGIVQLSEKMRKKLSLNDYVLSSEVANEQVSEIKSEPRKIYSLSQEDMRMLHEIHAKRLNSSNQVSIAQLMSEAIRLLYEQSNKNPPLAAF